MYRDLTLISITAPVDMDQLIGDTAGFAESGSVSRESCSNPWRQFLTFFAINRVGSAIIQRYIEKILHAALSRYDDIQKVAIDILSLTIHQGLAHPIQVSSIVRKPLGTYADMLRKLP
jgi:hypothetical protein